MCGIYYNYFYKFQKYAMRKSIDYEKENKTKLHAINI